MKKKLFVLTLIVSIMIFAPIQIPGEEVTIVLNCGTLTVEGYGGNAAVYAQANDNIDVEIDYYGELVKFNVYYVINNIDGSMDSSWCRIYYNGFVRDWVECNTGSSSGTLSFQLFCYPEDHVSIRLESEYADFIGIPGFEWHIDASDTSINTFIFNMPANNPPNKPAKPSGPTDVEIGMGFWRGSETCTYTSSTTDPDGNQLFYDFTCDDRDWFGPYVSGSPCSTQITWDTPGDFGVKCYAKDVPEYEEQDVKYSVWSKKLYVHVEYWWYDSVSYSEAISVHLSEDGAEILVPDPDPELIATSCSLCGFFAGNREIYDTFYSHELTDGENVITLTEEYQVSYYSSCDEYGIDFDGDFISDEYVSATDIEPCTDGNPYT